MDKEFVNYEQALALKELGFDEKCLGNYWEKLFYYEITFNHPTTMPNSPESCLAPLKQQVFRWFREKYNYNHSIIFHKHPFGTNDYQYMILLEDDEYVEVNFNPYEEAENACIDKLIEIVKQQGNG
jgi:hypothetical protein